MSPALTGKEQTDAVLTIRAQADDAAAFAELYDRHSVRAFRALARSAATSAVPMMKIESGLPPAASP